MTYTYIAISALAISPRWIKGGKKMDISDAVSFAASTVAGIMHEEISSTKPHSPKNLLLRAAFTFQSEGRKWSMSVKSAPDSSVVAKL